MGLTKSLSACCSELCEKMKELNLHPGIGPTNWFGPFVFGRIVFCIVIENWSFCKLVLGFLFAKLNVHSIGFQLWSSHTDYWLICNDRCQISDIGRDTCGCSSSYRHRVRTGTRFVGFWFVSIDFSSMQVVCHLSFGSSLVLCIRIYLNYVSVWIPLVLNDGFSC